MDNKMNKQKIESILNRHLSDDEYKEIVSVVLNKLLREHSNEK
ncbi:hypothetical protein J2W98_003839 [Paenibacillus peoriae]|uniref:Uncharacterized protein n=1 Tax=Paenibacillus peoriae TaxID=59893 RepID=A0ABU1QIS2_9BACL|nr:hypothetical protein [Paenibacillus peoriae]